MPLSSSFRNTWRKIQSISENRNIPFSEKGIRKRELCLTMWQWDIWAFTEREPKQQDIPTPWCQRAAGFRQNFRVSSDSLRDHAKGADWGISTQTRDSSQGIPCRIFGEQHVPVPISCLVLPGLEDRLKKSSRFLSFFLLCTYVHAVLWWWYN